MSHYFGTPYARGAGYVVDGLALPTGQRFEADMASCTHCQKAINLQKWRKKGAWCNRCFAPICLECGKLMLTQGCTPFIKRIEAYAEQMIRFDQLGLLVKDDAGHVLEQPKIILPA